LSLRSCEMCLGAGGLGSPGPQRGPPALRDRFTLKDHAARPLLVRSAAQRTEHL